MRCSCSAYAPQQKSTSGLWGLGNLERGNVFSYHMISIWCLFPVLRKLCSTVLRIFKVRAAGFLSGISLFSDFGFWKLAPGFYWFSNFKNSFAGFYCFLRFGSNSVLFSSFFSVFALKTPKKFPPAAGGILLFLKNFRLRRDLIFLQNP